MLPVVAQPEATNPRRRAETNTAPELGLTKASGWYAATALNARANGQFSPFSDNKFA